MKMKKLAAIILAAAMLLCTGVSSFAEETAPASESVQMPENIQKAKELSDRLSNREMAIFPDGSIVVTRSVSDIESSVFTAYAALNARKIVSAAYSDVAMLTHDGKLYMGPNLVGEGVADIVYCTNNVNQSGYVLTKEGAVSYMSDGYPPNVDGVNANPTDKLVSIPDSERHNFFFLTESGTLVVDGGDQYVWLEPQYSDWTNLVHVAAATYRPDSEPEAMTLVGIQKDGTVKVAGDYAEEILSWDKLSWVTGAEGVIVGVKEDGTLGITGERGKLFREDPQLAKWKDIVCVDVGFNCICAIDASGNYYFAHFEDYDEAPTCAVFSPDGYVRGGFEVFRYYPDGTVCITDNATRTWNVYNPDEYY